MVYVRLNKLSRHILSDFHCLGNSAALGNQPLQVIAGGQIATFLQRFELNSQKNLIHCLLHPFRSL